MSTALIAAAGRAPDLSAIIVNYNSGALLPACVAALRGAAGPLRLEIIVVDNGSTDGSLDALHGAAAADRVIHAGANLGFSRANNLGCAAARADYYLLLNTDCFVAPGLPGALLRRLHRDPWTAVVGPRLYNRDGTLQPSCHNFPNPLVLALEQSLLWRPLRRVPPGAHRLLIAGTHRRARPVDWLSGACLLVRARAFSGVGGFDEAFFFYWEEADLCRRLRGQGWNIWFEPAARALHLGGGSSQNPALLGQFFTSLDRFYRKHYSAPQRLLARLVIDAMALFKAGRAALGTRPRAAGRQDAWAALRQWLAIVRL